MASKDRITLVLKKAGDSYAGRFSDSFGLAKDVPVEDLTFKDNVLRFRVLVKSDGKDIRLRVGLNFDSGRLIGGIGVDSGNYGVLELSRRD